MKKFETINVSRTTYRKAMEIGKQFGLPGSYVIRAYIEYFLRKNINLKLIENHSDRVYPLKVRKEMKERIKKRAKELNLSVKSLIDLIFLNVSDTKKPIEAVSEEIYKLPKGEKFYILKSCFIKNIDYRDAAKIAKTKPSYAARAYKTFRKELKNVVQKKD